MRKNFCVFHYQKKRVPRPLKTNIEPLSLTFCLYMYIHNYTSSMHNKIDIDGRIKLYL